MTELHLNKHKHTLYTQSEQCKKQQIVKSVEIINIKKIAFPKIKPRVLNENPQ